MSKVRFSLIIGTCLGLTGCTPAEVQIAEMVVHEAVVAEQAIEHDLECPGEAAMAQEPTPATPPASSAQIKGKHNHQNRSVKRHDHDPWKHGF